MSNDRADFQCQVIDTLQRWYVAHVLQLARIKGENATVSIQCRTASGSDRMLELTIVRVASHKNSDRVDAERSHLHRGFSPVTTW
jgi:hypothetical protein